MSALKSWVPQNFLDLFKWRELVGAISLGLAGRLLWQQYGVLCASNRPPTDLGLPWFGRSFEVFRESLDGFCERMLKGRKVVLTNFLGANVAVIDWSLYVEHLHRIEIDGAMVGAWPASAKKMMGPDSILALPGGKGHTKHKRLRNKVLASLAPRAVLALVPDMIQVTRQALDAMVEETTKRGHCSLQPYASSLSADIVMLRITAGLELQLQEHVKELLDDMVSAAFSLPIELGRMTRCGRGMLARKRLRGIVEEVMRSPDTSRRNVIGDLMQVSEDGEAFTAGEIVDTATTLMLAGKFTTADAMPALVAHAEKYPDWAQRIAQEPLEFGGCEDDSATLRFLREVLRVQPPFAQYHRRLIDATQSIDLGEHGTIPAGVTLALFFGTALEAAGSDFNPDRWTAETPRQESLISFGGNQPHQCIGKNLALLELQVFLRVLCAEYEFETIDAELVAQSPFLAKTYKHGLKLKISRKQAC